MRFCRPTTQPAGLRTLATAINGGVIDGRGHAAQRDAHEAIAASPAEVIYLDPGSGVACGAGGRYPSELCTR